MKNLEEGTRHGLWLMLSEGGFQTKKLNEHGTLVSPLELLCDAAVLVLKETDDGLVREQKKPSALNYEQRKEVKESDHWTKFLLFN